HPGRVIRVLCLREGGCHRHEPSWGGIFHQQATHPPSNWRVWPVMSFAAGEARKTIAPTTSLTSPILPRGSCSIVAFNATAKASRRIPRTAFAAGSARSTARAGNHHVGAGVGDRQGLREIARQASHI